MINSIPDPEKKYFPGFSRDRMEYIASVREFIQQEREKIMEKHRLGAPGKEIVGDYSSLIDKVIEKAYELIMPTCEKTPNLTLAAIGGYGRAELSPFSDVDILFLHAQKILPWEQDLIHQTICFLWDIKLEVGHSYRSITNCIQMAKNDLTIKTSILEARYLVGSKEIFADFYRALQKEIIEKGVKDFIKQKIAERNQRYALYDNSANLLEPNVKESPGGLRDYHTVCWLAKTKFPSHTIDGLILNGSISDEERDSVNNAYDYILRVRNEMHLASQKKNDVLALQIQDKIANNLGYRPTGHFTKAESFMRDYYTQANIIMKFASTIINRCQEEKGFRKVMNYISKKELGSGLYVCEKEIQLKKGIDNPFKERPCLIMEVFGLAGEGNHGISEELKQLIRTHCYLIDENFRKDKEIAQKFFAILKQKRTGRVLRQMHELGIMGQYIPEFGEITCLIQHDLYHRYTIDEHCLRAIEHLEELPNSPETELKELTHIYQHLNHPEIVKLALLFHDLGKSQGPNHAEIGALIVRNILERLYLPEIVKKKVELLIQHHILMNQIAQHRDLHDKDVIKHFGGVVKDTDNLQRLYLLTYADLKAVGPEVWTVWKGALLWELYHKTRDYLSKGDEEAISGEELQERLRQELLEELIDEVEPAAIENHLERMPYKYILSTPAEKIAEHIRLIETLSRKDEELVLNYHHNAQIGYTEIMVCTHDKPGIFSQICGVLASKDLNILRAQIYTGKDSIAIDTLQVTTPKGNPLFGETLWEAIRLELTGILQGKKKVEDLVNKRRKVLSPLTEKKMNVPTVVKMDNKLSDTHTVIEIFTRDRLGLLFDITSTLYKLGMDIYLAKISTELQKAIDVFYVTNLSGDKIMDEGELSTIKATLLEALN
jgi:[protein-PII] uridylyltransferase